MAVGVKVVERARWRPVAVLVAAGLLFGSMIQPSSSRGGWDNPVPIVYAPAGLYPLCFEDERAALLGVKAKLNDPNDVLHGWSYHRSVCPCHWEGVQCHSDENFHVTHLDLANRGLSGTLSPRIGDLTSLHKLLGLLTELDVSNNSLNGSIPSSLGDLKNLSHMKLNNNSLSGPVPDSFGALVATLDLSFNNLSGPLPNLSSGALDITGNPLICGVDSGDTGCSHHQIIWLQHGAAISRRVSVTCAVAVSSIILVGILL